MIDTAQKFLDAIRTSGGDRALSDETGAVKVLEEKFGEHHRVAKDRGFSPSRTERFLFWSGAVLGAAIASHGYRMRLAAIASAAAKTAATEN
jgi:hypothetical protein